METSQPSQLSIDSNRDPVPHDVPVCDRHGARRRPTGRRRRGAVRRGSPGRAGGRRSRRQRSRLCFRHASQALADGGGAGGGCGGDGRPARELHGEICEPEGGGKPYRGDGDRRRAVRAEECEEERGAAREVVEGGEEADEVDNAHKDHLDLDKHRV